jgi:outer membrane protein assembly factor BamB
VIIEASDDTFTRFDLATGQKSAVDLGGQKRPSCTQVYQTRGARSPKYGIVESSEFAAHKLPESVPGLNADRALAPTTAGLSFLLGSRDKGTQVAMVAAVEDGKVLWKDLVPGVDPLSTESNVTDLLAASDGTSVAIPYGMAGHSNGVRMACFDGRSGKRLWDVEIHKKINVETGIAIEAGRVYYASWTGLYVLSLQDGKMLYKLGRDF